MKSVLRSAVAVPAGLLVLIILVVAIELFSAVVHPFPDGFKETTEEICRHVERYPQWVLAVVVPAWAAAAFASTWTAGRIGNVYSASIVGLLLLAALACNVSMLPYPTWFKIANLLVIPLAVFAGIRSSMSRKTTNTDAGN
ncbi:MAG: hypothetical protein V4719_24860 [Planctomycetota bacterium]